MAEQEDVPLMILTKSLPSLLVSNHSDDVFDDMIASPVMMSSFYTYPLPLFFFFIVFYCLRLHKRYFHSYNL